MSEKIQIRTVKVELLRSGPSHNQLLSPLTPYLGICNGAEAGVVQVPFEHEAFMRKLEALRDTGADARTRGPVLRELGLAIARVLGAVPRLPGSLDGDSAGPDTLVHLRLVLSAAELALLPFELSKTPVTATDAAEGWLSLQAQVPVVVTRRTRDAATARVRWAQKPRILFIASDPEVDAIPFNAHRQALLEAVWPYLHADCRRPTLDLDGRRERFGDQLTILKNASYDDVQRECSRRGYTHIHLLAHGGVDNNVGERSFGLLLHPRPGEDDVVSGERFASAFANLDESGIRRPLVVTLATCDSGNAGSVLIPGASMAHALHHAGIPLVVASQFPLSMEGSSLVLRQLYPGLLAGDNPITLLHRIRTDLHGRLATQSHDWASLVVYEALPATDALAMQLDELRYQQADRAVKVAFDLLDREMQAHRDRLPPQRQADLVREVQHQAARLPIDGDFRLECLGLRGSSNKRLASLSFWAAMATPAKEQATYERHMTQCCALLEDSLHDYAEAAKGYLMNQGGRQRHAASLHWVMGQQLSVAAALGKPMPPGAWELALLSATTYLEEGEGEERGWSLGSLIELWLLKLVQPGLLQLASSRPDAARKERIDIKERALQHARSLVSLARSRDDAQVESTRQQLLRYLDWWGNPHFEKAAAFWGGTRSADKRRGWQHLGVTDLAAKLLEVLDMGGPREALPALPAAKVLLVPPPAPGPLSLAPPSAEAAMVPAATPVPAPQALPAPARTPAGLNFLGPTAGGVGTPFLRIDMLPAEHGDCLWVEYGRGNELHRLLIDCGTEAVYRQALKPRLQALPAAQRAFELFVLSHVDDDHIGGGIAMLRDQAALQLKFKDIWFNGWQHLKQFGFLGALQGEKFSELLGQPGLPWNLAPGGGAVVLPDQGDLPHCTLPGGLRLVLLSPDQARLRKMALRWRKEIAKLGKEPGAGDFLAGEERRSSTSTDVPALADAPFTPDGSEANGSSITLLAEYEGKRVLFGADAHAPLLCATLDRLLARLHMQRLPLDAFKLPHHGSQNNLSRELLQRLDCRRYLFSSNGAKFYHPDREAVARVIRYGGPGAQLYFNYRSSFSGVWADPALQARYGYTAHYPEAGQAGLKVAL